VLIAVAGGVQPNDGITSLTWKNLLLVIESACKNADKTVELDLSGSTLALFGTDFDYKDGNGGNGYETGEKYIKKLILPRDATSITSAFYKDPFSILEEVSGLNVSIIPNDAFRELSTLAAVDFPAAKTIGASAFQNCASLTSVSLPAAETIGSNAFNGCSSLTEVSLPAATSIDQGAFYNCASLAEVSLPAAKTIGIFAFQSYASLTGVSLPAATSIGMAAFQSCASLTTITIAKECEINDNSGNSGLRNNFKTYYGDKDKAAGVYTYSSDSWSYKPLAGTP
jgi:hypothetical protein